MPIDPSNELHVGRPNLGDREVFDHLVGEMFERRWFSNNGELVQALERRIEEYLGVKHCVLVCNATIGLQLACEALELKGEVIVPAYTFVASAHALTWQKLRPVFCDVDRSTHNLDPALVENLITKDTSAILGVHVWGRPCVPGELERLGRDHGIPVMFDAAHAFGCAEGSTMVGNFGRCEVFSFHATKFFNTFEGGAITTNDDQLAARLRRMKNFGFSGMDQVDSLGTNAKMSEIQAAMGLSVFEALDSILETNREHHELYRSRLDGREQIRFLDYEEVSRTNHQYVVIEMNEGRKRRDQVLEHLRSHEVYARRYFFPGCHRMEPYRSRFPEQVDSCPATVRLCDEVIVLPTGTAVSGEDVNRVCDLIEEALTSDLA